MTHDPHIEIVTDDADQPVHNRIVAGNERYTWTTESFVAPSTSASSRATEASDGRHPLPRGPHQRATSMQIRYCEEEEPVVWMAVAEFDGIAPQVAAALNPGRALFRLLEQLVDGGECTHCHRPTGITLDLDDQLASALICWAQYDPELKKFRRGCEDGTS